MKPTVFRRITAAVFIYSMVLLSVVPASAATPSEKLISDLDQRLKNVEKRMESRRKELGIPGVAMAIVKDGKIVLSKGYGYKDFEKKIPMTADTQLAIGSATKAFTGLSAVMMQDRGKISLDESPRKYLPYFKMNNAETDKNMQVRDLLIHSSGLNRTDLAMITGKLNRVELIKVAGEAKPIIGLRKRFLYQNIMFAAAGEVVGAAYGDSWDNFVPKEIFKPLGMSNSTMNTGEFKKAKDFSYGYSYNFDTKKTKRLPKRDISHIGPAGSINSSANDMSKWLNFIIDGGAVNGKRLVSEKGFAEWTKGHMNVTPNGSMKYGLGWFIEEWNKKQVIHHGGNIDGFSSMVAVMPEEKLGVVFLSNVSGSALQSEIHNIVWEEIIGDSSIVKAGPEQKKEVGLYAFPQAGFDIKVEIENGVFVAKVPGQPTYKLVQVEGRKYKLANAPDGFFMTFKDDSMDLQQPNGTFNLKKKGTKSTGVSSEEPKPKKKESNLIEPSELISKVVEAAGGKDAMMAVKSRKIEFKLDAVHQGVKGKGYQILAAPNKSVSKTELLALGKKIGWTREVFNGKAGYELYSFAEREDYTGKRLIDVTYGMDFRPFLGYEKKGVSASVLRKDKFRDKEVYLLSMTPKGGSRVIYFVDVNDFTIYQKVSRIVSSTSSVTQQLVEKYEDYKKVDGLFIAHKITITTQGMGDIITYVEKVTHNVKTDEDMFKIDG